MAIQWMDNFSSYGSTSALMLNGLYAQIDGATLVTDPDGISGGHVLFGAVNADGARRVLSSFQNTCGQAARLWMANLPTGSTGSGMTPTMEFRDAGNNVIASWGCDTTGRLSVYSGTARIFGSTVTPLQTTTNPVLTANAWYHIEMWITMSGSGLADLHYELRVEGVPVLSGTAFATAHAGPVGQVFMGANNFFGSSWYWKDYITADGSGSLNNTFLGSCVVVPMTQSSDISLGGWTLTGGATGSAVLNTNPPQDGVIYTQAGLLPVVAESFNLSDLPINVTSIRSIQTQVRATKADGGDGNLQVSLLSGAATGAGANRPITAAYTYWQDQHETDPNTGAAWTVAAANAARLKIDRTV